MGTADEFNKLVQGWNKQTDKLLKQRAALEELMEEQHRLDEIKRFVQKGLVPNEWYKIQGGQIDPSTVKITVPKPEPVDPFEEAVKRATEMMKGA